MIIPIRFFFLLICLFTLNSLWALVTQAVFPRVFKKLHPCSLEKLYFWSLMIPPIFLFSCLIICGIAENHWQLFWAGHSAATSCTEFLHCDLVLNKFNFEYLAYCLIGLGLIGLFLINLLKCFININNYRAVSLNSLPKEKAHQLRNIIKRAKEKTGNNFPMLEAITSHPNLAFVKGIFSHRIFISSNLIDELSDDELESILINEWGHCQKRDNLKNLVLMISQSMNFWPYLRKKLLQTCTCLREIACDEAAMLISQQPLEIAHSIIKVGKLAAKAPVTQVQGYALSFVSQFNVEGHISARVHNLIHHFDASQKEGNYFEKLSRRRKQIKILEYGALITIMLIALYSGCLEYYLIKTHCLIEEVVHLVISI